MCVFSRSPFLPTTNDGLFNWARDAAILKGTATAPAPAAAAALALSGSERVGLSPAFEFRVRTKVDAGARALLQPEWRALVTAAT